MCVADKCANDWLKHRSTNYQVYFIPMSEKSVRKYFKRECKFHISNETICDCLTLVVYFV